jgi:hypothetical protein
MNIRRMMLADVAVLAVVFTIGLIISAMWPEAHVTPPSHVVCLTFDMSSPDGRGRWKGWHPVAFDKRQEIGKLVNAGAAEWMEAKTADCYERHPMNPRLGELVESGYMEWWRWVEKPKRKVVITH